MPPGDEAFRSGDRARARSPIWRFGRGRLCDVRQVAAQVLHRYEQDNRYINASGSDCLGVSLTGRHGHLLRVVARDTPSARNTNASATIHGPNPSPEVMELLFIATILRIWFS